MLHAMRGKPGARRWPVDERGLSRVTIKVVAMKSTNGQMHVVRTIIVEVNDED